MLTPDLIAKFNQASGNNVPLDGSAGAPPTSRADEVRALGKPAASSYDVAMGKKNPDGTPNTDKGIIPQAVDTFKAGFTQTKEGANNPDVGAGAQQIGRGVLNEAAAGLRIFSSPLEAATKIAAKIPGISQIVGGVDAATKKIGDFIGQNKHLQDFVTSNPNAEEVIGNLIGIGSTIAAGKAGAPDGIPATKLGEFADKTLSDVKGKVTDTLSSASDKVKGMVTKDPQVEQATLEKSAINDATPSYHKSLIGEPGIKELDANGKPTGKTIPRVSEPDSKNPFAMRTVTSTPSEIAAGKELSKIEGYNPKGTSLEKYNSVVDGISKKSNAYRASLDSENVVIPKKEMVSTVKKAVTEASQGSVLLQKTDPIVKNYIRVATNAAEKVDGTLAGMDKLRLALDQAYEDAGGKYGNNKGLDQIHRAARNSITKSMAEKAQSTQVKASLKEMENLYKASDVLKDKAQAEGGSKWEQFKKAHPIMTKTGGKIMNAVGIGEAVHLAP